jgi:predicted DNA-binding transcriptional regulator AlpA
VLHALADRIDSLDLAQVLGELEVLRVRLWTAATMNHDAPAPVPGCSRALDVQAVVERTGMSKDWLYREARAGRLPFARRLGRRVVFDEAGCKCWLERRSGQRRS